MVFQVPNGQYKVKLIGNPYQTLVHDVVISKETNYRVDFVALLPQPSSLKVSLYLDGKLFTDKSLAVVVKQNDAPISI